MADFCKIGMSKGTEANILESLLEVKQRVKLRYPLLRPTFWGVLKRKHKARAFSLVWHIGGRMIGRLRPAWMVP